MHTRRKGEPLQRSTSTMKTARKLSSSIRSVGRSISKKFSLSKPQQQLQVVCPVDAYPGKQIAIQTPDGQTLNVIVPRNVMPGMPFNVLYTPVVQQPQNKSPANQPKRSTCTCCLQRTSHTYCLDCMHCTLDS